MYKCFILKRSTKIIYTNPNKPSPRSCVKCQITVRIKSISNKVLSIASRVGTNADTARRADLLPTNIAAYREITGSSACYKNETLSHSLTTADQRIIVCTLSRDEPAPWALSQNNMQNIRSSPPPPFSWKLIYIPYCLPLRYSQKQRRQLNNHVVTPGADQIFVCWNKYH